MCKSSSFSGTKDHYLGTSRKIAKQSIKVLGVIVEELSCFERQDNYLWANLYLTNGEKVACLHTQGVPSIHARMSPLLCQQTADFTCWFYDAITHRWHMG